MTQSTLTLPSRVAAKCFLTTFALSAMSLSLLCSCGITARVEDQEREFEAKKADLEAKMNAKGKIVYAIKDIEEGAEIPSNALEEKEIEQSKIPQDALTSASLAAGRIAKYGVSQGQILSQHDLASQNAKPSVVVNLDESTKKKLSDLAKSKGQTASSLASQWVTEKLNSISK